MKSAVRIVLRDGFLEVTGECKRLKDKLRYFRKEVELVGYERKVTKHFEELFTEDSNDEDHIVTMPGFAHKVLDFFRKAGRKYEFADARTPFPQPDYARAFKGLRPYQVPLVGKMIKSGGGILRGSTGMGKTCCAAAIIRAFDKNELTARGTPTCVFACPDRDINRKNWEEFQRWLPDREIGLIMSGSGNVPSDDVVCCTIDSLEHLDPDQVGILIVDEMHASASSGRAEKIAAFTKARRWGVSATPTGRFDGADIVAEGLYGPIVAEFTYQDGVETGALVPITVMWLDAPPPTCGLELYGKFKKREAKLRHGSLVNEDFTRMVADIMNCVPKSMQTLCMLQFIEQMHYIKKFCNDSVGVVHAETNPDKLRSFPSVPAIKPKERKAIYDGFRNGEINSIISTHCWKQGVDFPNLSIVINAGGGGSEIVAKQVPGRASRKTDGKDQAYIIDFVHKWDREDPVTFSGKPGPLLSCDFARRKAYNDLGFTQVSCNSLMDLPFLKQEEVMKTPTYQRSRRQGLQL